MPRFVAPPGWPVELPPPASDDFGDQVIGWLLDRGPLWLRQDETWRNQPQALVMVVAYHSEHVLSGLREAYSAARRELVDVLAAGDVDRVLIALEAAGAQAAESSRQVALVAEALAGKRWRQRL
jgi:hypothetical protein